MVNTEAPISSVVVLLIRKFMKRRGLDVSFNHINLSIATQTQTMAERSQGLGGAPAMSGASSAHCPVLETDDGNELEEAHIDIESAFANSHETSESSSDDQTPSDSGIESKFVEAPPGNGSWMCQK
jgi:hypothetical protein